MNMFARFDENPAMTLRVIKETKHYWRTHGRTDARTDGRTDNVKTVYPLQTKFAGGIITNFDDRGDDQIYFRQQVVILFFSILIPVVGIESGPRSNWLDWTKSEHLGEGLSFNVITEKEFLRQWSACYDRFTFTNKTFVCKIVREFA